MTSRPDPADRVPDAAAADEAAPDGVAPDGAAPDGGGPDPSRRTLVRGIALLGLAGVAGLSLAACGGGDTTVSADGPPLPDSGAVPGNLPSKSQVYRRTPEPRPRRTTASSGATRPAPEAPAEPAPAPRPTLEKPALSSEPAAAAVPAEPAAGSRASGAQTTARKPGPQLPKPADPRAGQARTADTKAAQTKAGQTTGGPAKAAPAPSPPPAAPSTTLDGARTSDIPVGGGRIYPKDAVVVTQPTKGTFKGFSALCTHQKCTVGEVKDGSIICLCHGSRFSVADGSVQKGPALLPLPAEQITVEGDRIVHGGHGSGHSVGSPSRRSRLR